MTTAVAIQLVGRGTPGAIEELCTMSSQFDVSLKSVGRRIELKGSLQGGLVLGQGV